MTEDAAAPTRRSRRRRRWLVVLVLTLAFLLARVGLDLWAGHRLDQEVARLEKRHGSLAERTLHSPASIPPADNRARVARAAAALSLLDYGSRQDVAPQRYLAPVPSPRVPAAVRAYVELNRPAISIAEETRRRGKSSWEADYVSGVGIPPLMDVRLLSNAICLAALIDLEDGRPDSAAHAAGTGLAVASTLRWEPSLIAQLIRIAVATTQLQAAQRIVTGGDPSGSALEDLARWLAESRSPSPIGVGLLGEARIIHARMTRFEDGGLEDVYAEPLSWLAGPLARLGRPLLRLVHLRYLQQVGALLDRQAGPRPCPEITSRPTPSRWTPATRWASNFTLGLARSIEAGDEFISQLNAVELGVALRRFRLASGSYPDDLSALVPKYLPAVPIDPFTGRPPVYARRDAGFELHAEGPKNRTPRPPGLDWVVVR